MRFSLNKLENHFKSMFSNVNLSFDLPSKSQKSIKSFSTSMKSTFSFDEPI